MTAWNSKLKFSYKCTHYKKTDNKNGKESSTLEENGMCKLGIDDSFES